MSFDMLTLTDVGFAIVLCLLILTVGASAARLLILFVCQTLGPTDAERAIQSFKYNIQVEPRFPHVCPNHPPSNAWNDAVLLESSNLFIRKPDPKDPEYDEDSEWSPVSSEEEEVCEDPTGWTRDPLPPRLRRVEKDE